MSSKTWQTTKHDKYVLLKEKLTKIGLLEGNRVWENSQGNDKLNINSERRKEAIFFNTGSGG